MKLPPKAWGRLAAAGVLLAASSAALGFAAEGRSAASTNRAPAAAAGKAASHAAQASTVPVGKKGVPDRWWVPGDGRVFPAELKYSNGEGEFGLFNANGAVKTAGHPFFTAIGQNGRSCSTCHQPADGMSISVPTVQDRWKKTGGKDPLFAMVDGANCPSLPPGERASHSLLLDRGLFRIAYPWPEKADREFTIEVVRDPAGCNTDPKYGLNSPNPTISVYRRPRPAMNLKYVVGRDDFRAPFIAKNGLPSARDPDTGQPVTMQIMSDAREPTLKTQAISAYRTHLEGKAAQPTDAQLKEIIAFESQVYGAQIRDRSGSSLTEKGGPPALGPKNLASSAAGVLADYLDNPVFKTFEMWKRPVAGETPRQREFRASVARGADVFFLRPFWIKDVMHLNTVGLGNPTKRTCATCHNMQMVAMDASNGWMDLGTANLPWAKTVLPSPFVEAKDELPLFKVTCRADVPPHPFYGRVIYTYDPGRALTSGKCNDVGAIVMQQFRGLSARAPYFSNGSARNLRELVDFYDNRFSSHYSEQEKQDLVNFLSVL